MLSYGRLQLHPRTTNGNNGANEQTSNKAQLNYSTSHFDFGSTLQNEFSLDIRVLSTLTTPSRKHTNNQKQKDRSEVDPHHQRTKHPNAWRLPLHLHSWLSCAPWRSYACYAHHPSGTSYTLVIFQVPTSDT